MVHLDVPEILIVLGVAGFFGLWLHNLALQHNGHRPHTRHLHRR